VAKKYEVEIYCDRNCGFTAELNRYIHSTKIVLGTYYLFFVLVIRCQTAQVGLDADSASSGFSIVEI
jgi:hypothetical protein